MSHFAEAFAWCMLQVTLFSLVSACLYSVVVRFRLGGAAGVLTGSLAVVAMLTLLCVSPWPRWIPTQFDLAHGGVGQVADTSRTIARSELQDSESEPVAIHSATQESAAGPKTADAFLTDPRRTDSRHESNVWSLPPWPLVLLTAAGIAAAVGLSRLLVGAFYLWRYCRRSRPIDDHRVHDLVSELVAKLAISRRVAIRESDLLAVAATAGWRRPLVLLPAAWCAWTPAELRVVLAHELAHIQQRHFPSWALAQLPLAAHYYHPLMHWLVRRLRLEHEVVADALAATVFGDRPQYATVLAGLALHPTAPRGPFAPLGVFMSRPLLMRRIAMLRQTTENSRRTSRVAKAILCLMILAAAIMAAGMRAANAADEKRPESAPANDRLPFQEESAASERFPWELNESPMPNPTPERVIAIIQVMRNSDNQSPDREATGDDAWKIYRNTQVALLNSSLVRRATLQKPEIAGLALAKSATDPLELVSMRLAISPDRDTELIYLKFACSKAEVEDAIKIVNAIIETYLDRFVQADQQRRAQVRDRLEVSYRRLSDELSKKMEQFAAIAQETDSLEGGRGRAAQQIDLNRLNRIDGELADLESQHLAATIYHEQEREPLSARERAKIPFYEQRIKQLRTQQEVLVKHIASRSESSVELQRRKDEISRLQRIADDLATRLELMNLDADTPRSRVQVIQPAM